jgi:hypothetical protein
MKGTQYMIDTNIQTPEWLLQMTPILEALNEGAVIVDDQLRIIFANEALVRLGGYDRGDVCGPAARRTPFSHSRISHTSGNNMQQPSAMGTIATSFMFRARTERRPCHL